MSIDFFYFSIKKNIISIGLVGNEKEEAKELARKIESIELDFRDLEKNDTLQNK